MMLAWFSSSERMRTPGPPSVHSTPRLAANPVGKQTAASVPFHAAELPLELAVDGAAPGHQARGAGAGAPAGERTLGGRHHGRMGAQSEIVVGRERDDRRRPRAGPPGRGRRTPAGRASGPRRRPDPGRPGCGRPRCCRRRSCGWRARRGRPAPQSSASTIRTISSAVVVSGGISTTTSPSGRSSTPRETAPAHTRRPQRSPGAGGCQLDTDHQSTLTNLAHLGPTGDPFSQQ